MSPDLTYGRGVRLIRDKTTNICWVLDVSRKLHLGIVLVHPQVVFYSVHFL